jgi:hypothetical protein
MTHRKSCPLLGLGLALALGAGAARAQQEPVSAEAGAKSDACRALDEQDLPRLLENMGFEPETVDEGVYKVTIEQDSWTFYLRFSLSTDNRTRLWMTSSFGEIKEIDKVPPAPFIKLLETNDGIGPAHFYITTSGEAKRLNVAKALDNRGITPAVLRREIDSFLGIIKSSVSQWDTSTWARSGAAPEATPAAEAEVQEPPAEEPTPQSTPAP